MFVLKNPSKKSVWRKKEKQKYIKLNAMETNKFLNNQTFK